MPMNWPPNEQANIWKIVPHGVLQRGIRLATYCLHIENALPLDCNANEGLVVQWVVKRTCASRADDLVFESRARLSDPSLLICPRVPYAVLHQQCWRHVVNDVKQPTNGRKIRWWLWIVMLYIGLDLEWEGVKKKHQSKYKSFNKFILPLHKENQYNPQG